MSSHLCLIGYRFCLPPELPFSETLKKAVHLTAWLVPQPPSSDVGQWPAPPFRAAFPCVESCIERDVGRLLPRCGPSHRMSL